MCPRYLQNDDCSEINTLPHNEAYIYSSAEGGLELLIMTPFDALTFFGNFNKRDIINDSYRNFSSIVLADYCFELIFAYLIRNYNYSSSQAWIKVYGNEWGIKWSYYR